MSDTTNLGPLILALSKAQRAFPLIGKDKSAKIQMRTGGSYSYQYADLATILGAVRKPLAENELAIWQRATFNNDLVGVQTVLAHSSGQSISSELQMPVGDNHDPRSVASVITYTRRYGLIALLGIAPADEDDDADTATPRAWTVHQPLTARPDPPEPLTARPDPPEGYRYIDHYKFENGWHHASFFKADAQGGAMVFKTKLTHLGALAQKAAEEQIPVKIEGKPGYGKDEWWLDKIDVWTPPAPALTDEDIPF